jgi:hypothetical protein
MVTTINEKIEKANNIKFNKKPIEKVDFLYSDNTKDDYKLNELINFLKWEKNIIKFVDWTTNTVYLRTDVEQPIYLTDPDNYAKTLDNRFALNILD